jgi:hypothetical protein
LHPNYAAESSTVRAIQMRLNGDGHAPIVTTRPPRVIVVTTTKNPCVDHMARTQGSQPSTNSTSNLELGIPRSGARRVAAAHPRGLIGQAAAGAPLSAS